MFSIGEFSKITLLPVKTLRYYHEVGILVPYKIDEDSGYRYYNQHNIERARAISELRSLEFSLDQITEILEEYGDDSQLLDVFSQRFIEVKQQVEKQENIADKLEQLIEREEAFKKYEAASSPQVVVKKLESMLVAGIRIKGEYSTSGDVFSRLGKTIGRFISGKAMCLLYDDEYKELDADFEPCFPIRKVMKKGGVDCRELPGGEFLSILHYGPFDQVGSKYQQLISYAQEYELQLQSPCREVYVKGPGMIFKGNPENYITELLMPFSKSREQS